MAKVTARFEGPADFIEIGGKVFSRGDEVSIDEDDLKHRVNVGGQIFSKGERFLASSETPPDMTATVPDREAEVAKSGKK